MTNFIEKKASTSEEAIRLALEELQMDRDDVSIEFWMSARRAFSVSVRHRHVSASLLK